MPRFVGMLVSYARSDSSGWCFLVQPSAVTSSGAGDCQAGNWGRKAAQCAAASSLLPEQTAQ